uniref:Putative secreted protein n=1 Tax=Anopheles darlingi TaxID=43151 RepID=A0A2M4D8Z9_ANODA
MGCLTLTLSFLVGYLPTVGCTIVSGISFRRGVNRVCERGIRSEVKRIKQSVKTKATPVPPTTHTHIPNRINYQGIVSGRYRDGCKA